MDLLFANLHITFNYNFHNIINTARLGRQWLFYFDKQYLKNYWHVYQIDERTHIVDSIANDYFNTNQYYDYEDAIIMFYINFNLDRVYYFDHTHKY